MNWTNSNGNSATNSTLSISKPQTEHNIERLAPNHLRVQLHCYQKQHNTRSGQTPDKEVKIKNINVYVSGYTETDTTGMLSPPTVW